MKRLLLCALSAVAASSWAQFRVPVAVAGHRDPAKPRQTIDEFKTASDLIRATMRKEPIVNVRVIVVQRLYYDSSVFQQVKVEMSKDGKVRQTVLAPLSQQGTELVDDGQTLRIYTPDDKRLIEQPSDQQGDGEISFRMNLVDQNYTLRISRKVKIAGRDALVVEAVPRHESLETRCYSIDDKTGLLLRLETCKEGRSPMLHLDTKAVEFPATFSEDTFKLDPAFSRTESFHDRCVSPKSAGELTVELGFQPAVPAKLPYGFEAQELQASTDSPARALIVRVTDGLEKATVLEWRKEGRSASDPPAGTLVQNSGGLTLLISGDLPDDVKRRLLQVFAAVAQGERLELIPYRGGSWGQELVCSVNVFPVDREAGGNGPATAIPVIVRI
ncbi:MAG TPA: sigma-E factor regulatory protein RseB domain-containing protein [Fimbriimonadaceae bacterium]|nr:sigma-E factor regulatory protein RseB domain-containing protein [Fimbriimonadaceae bacterium]